jgi:hypothetical protein
MAYHREAGFIGLVMGMVMVNIIGSGETATVYDAALS